MTADAGTLGLRSDTTLAATRAVNGRVVGFLTFLFVIAATLETVTWDAAGATIRPVHVVLPALALSIAGKTDAVSSRLMRSVAAVSLSVMLLAIGPLAAHGDGSRLLFPLLLVVNLGCAAVVFAAVRNAGEPALQGVSWALFVIMAVPVGQTVAALFDIVPPFADARFLFTGRPPGTFEEATWVGAMAAFALAWAGYRRNPLLAGIALAALVAAASRGALVGAGVTLLIVACRGVGWSGRAVSRLVYAAVLVASVALTPVAFMLPTPAFDATTLDSRLLDQHAIVDMLGDDWAFGGASLLVDDAPRARVLPSSSNNVYMDFLWKQGVFGIATLVILGWAALRRWPRLVEATGPMWMQPAPFLIVTISLWMCVLNNAVLRPWLWIEYGIGLAVMVMPTRSVEPRTVERGSGAR